MTTADWMLMDRAFSSAICREELMNMKEIAASTQAMVTEYARISLAWNCILPNTSDPPFAFGPFRFRLYRKRGGKTRIGR